MKEEETFDVYVTKYALTQGIFKMKVRKTGSPQMVAGGAPMSRGSYFHGEGKEWHRTREDAVARAEEMRTKKIASLTKKISKLERIRFEGFVRTSPL